LKEDCEQSAKWATGLELYVEYGGRMGGAGQDAWEGSSVCALAWWLEGGEGGWVEGVGAVELELELVLVLVLDLLLV
jgi:hypothetical protein